MLNKETPQSNHGNVVTLDAFRKKLAEEGREPRKPLSIKPENEHTVTSIAEFTDHQFREEILRAFELPENTGDEQLLQTLNERAGDIRKTLFLKQNAPIEEVLARLRTEWGYAKKEAK